MNKNFLKSVTHTTRGIIWITKEIPTIDSQYSKEINYLLDGLLYKELQNSDNFLKEHNLFLGKSFNQDIFIIHQLSNQNVTNAINKTLSMIPIGDRDEILILNNDKELNIDNIQISNSIIYKD